CEALRDKVVGVLQKGRVPVILGGDHSIAMGTIAGVSRFHRERDGKVGLVWFDAHGDMNTPETSPSGNIHGMPLAAALGLGEKSVVGLRDVDPAERENLKDSGIGAFTMRDIDERGMRTVMEEAIKRATSGTEGIHVSF